jgi:hypothetical protein
MNLTLNGIDAMKETDRVRELTIMSEAGDEQSRAGRQFPFDAADPIRDGSRRSVTR